MKYYTKSAQYYKYFEDAKLIEIDEENKKLAIVLNGKEEIIDIFDAGPYVDYNPLENFIKDIKFQSFEENKDKKYGILQIKEEPNYLNVNQIFKEIKKYKKDFKNNLNQPNFFTNNKKFKININSNLNNSENKLVEGKNLFIYERQNNLKKNNHSTLPRLLSILNEQNNENKNNNKNKEEVMNGWASIKKYTNLSISKFQIYYLSLFNSCQKIKLNVKKPKIKHKLLSVIYLDNDTILGIKWFSCKKNKECPKNISENEKYVFNSKLLLVVSHEGLISIYKLIKYEPFCHIRVNMTLPGLQSQPFTNFKEKYSLESSLKLYNPIIDYNLLNKLLEENNIIERRLITLHINNTFTFWYLVNENDKVKIALSFNFQLSNFICENFLMDSNEEYLICFNKKGIMILLSKGQFFPYPIVYRYTYNEIIPSLKELKHLIYSNEVIDDSEEEESETDNDISEEYDEKEIINKNGEINKVNEEKRIKRKYIKSGKYKNKNKNKKKEKKKKKNKEEKTKKTKLKKKYVKSGKYKNKKKEEDLIIIKNNIDSNTDENNEGEEEEFEEDEDDFFDENEFMVEGYSNFINADEDVFYEDDKYLKFLQKPCFLSFESKFLFVNYEIKTNNYSLYCFNFSELYKVEDDQNFLSICLNEYDDILITKIFSSKEKIYFSESPFYYFNPIKDLSIDNNLLSTIQNRKILMYEKKFDLNTIISNLYQGLFIREGDNIMIIKISIKDKPDLDIINKDISLSKFKYYEQPTRENLKSNFLAKWTINNTLLINSVDNLFNIIKFSKESNILGIPLSKDKIEEIMKIYFK